ncbi:ASCH domain-containing protein [bacterium]|nr:ASCH domain-containing protein [bacterium]
MKQNFALACFDPNLSFGQTSHNRNMLVPIARQPKNLNSVDNILITMAILGFHFSSVYKEVLYDGTKTATIMEGEHYFKIGQEVLVYLSDKPNLFDGDIEKRIGKAQIEKVEIKRVKDLTEPEAKLCGSKSLEELKNTLKKWYNADENSVITYVKFNLIMEK